MEQGTPTLAEAGETRDKVAKAIGMSHSTMAKADTVYQAAVGGGMTT